MDISKVLHKIQNLTHKPFVPQLSNVALLDDKPRNLAPSNININLESEFKERSLHDEQTNLLRLQYDFEFLQHLVSPDYIKHLFKKGYFEKQEFINYLEYLKYFERPEYLKLLVNPKCLDALSMLLREDVRTEIKRNNDFANFFAF